MSTPTRQDARGLLKELYKPEHLAMYMQNDIIEKFANDWYRQGKLDGVEEYTTGKLVGTVRDVGSVPTPLQKA